MAARTTRKKITLGGAGFFALVALIAGLFITLTRRSMQIVRFESHPAASRRSVMNLRLKRAMDISTALLGLIVLSPVLLIVALTVRLRHGSPVLFRQTRPGLNGQPFEILKFRTMTETRDANEKLLPDADRLTSLGQFLRRTSLDELPELINILRGDMSVVGPRPLRMRYLERYTSRQARRHEVRPGITGWAQINGRNGLEWETRFEMDVWYVDHWSLWLDLKIILLTAWKVIKQEGISQEGHATMTEFKGTPQDKAA